MFAHLDHPVISSHFSSSHLDKLLFFFVVFEAIQAPPASPALYTILYIIVSQLLTATIHQFVHLLGLVHLAYIRYTHITYTAQRALVMTSFLDLPFHIRQNIYRHAVVPGKVFVKPFISFKYFENASFFAGYEPPNLALFRVCKAVYQEAGFLFYSENVFSILQPDILLVLLDEYPHIANYLKHMHKVELVFDYRDFQYISDDFCCGLQFTADLLQRADDRHTAALAHDFAQLRSFILRVPARTGRRESVVDDPTTHRQVLHDHNINVLRTYLWGRALTFVAQKLLVTNLHLDFHNCYCPGGCCRLARHVMKWAWSPWVYDLPVNVSLSGTAAGERKEIMDAIATRTVAEAPGQETVRNSLPKAVAEVQANHYRNRESR